MLGSMAAMAELQTVAFPLRLVQTETSTHAAHFPSIARSGLITNPTKFCIEGHAIRANQTNQILHGTEQNSYRPENLCPTPDCK